MKNYKKALELVKNNKNYRRTIRFYKNHKFEFFNYILPDYNDFKKNDSFFMRGYLVIDEKIEVSGLKKFFNIGENIDWNISDISECLISEKLDGTLIIPFLLDGNLEFRTKMSIGEMYSDEAKRALTKELESEILDYLNNGYNVYCELITPLEKHVVNYNGELSLNIICLEKDNIYKPYKSINLDFKNINELIDFTESQENIEGYVLYSKDKIYKLKSSEYCRKHKAKSDITLNYNLVNLILNEEIDDIKSMLNDKEKEYIDYLTKELIREILEVLDFYKNIDLKDRKEFALKNKNYKYFDFIMKIFGRNTEDELVIKKFKEYIILKFNGLEKCNKFFKTAKIKNFNEFLIF